MEKNKVNQHIIEFCESDFTRWYNSRGKYMNTHISNILAQFLPSKASVDRDYANSPLCSAFNLAMELQHSRNATKYLCFCYVYFKQHKPKTLKAHVHFDLNDTISIQTAINWAHETAQSIYGTAILTVKMHEMMSNREFTF